MSTASVEWAVDWTRDRGTRRDARSSRTARRVAPAAPLRLTRRGRVVVTLLFLAVLFAGFVAVSAHSAATSQAGRPVPTRMIRVAPGETLWAIATRVAHGGDVRAVVTQIEELNALPGAALQEGQRLAVPVTARTTH